MKYLFNINLIKIGLIILIAYFTPTIFSSAIADGSKSANLLVERAFQKENKENKENKEKDNIEIGAIEEQPILNLKIINIFEILEDIKEKHPNGEFDEEIQNMEILAGKIFRTCFGFWLVIYVIFIMYQIYKEQKEREEEKSVDFFTKKNEIKTYLLNEVEEVEVKKTKKKKFKKIELINSF